MKFVPGKPLQAKAAARERWDETTPRSLSRQYLFRGHP
jgi:hypothetical protein